MSSVVSWPMSRTEHSTCLGRSQLDAVSADALHRRPGPQELRRHVPDHPSVRQEEDRPRPLRPQRPSPRRPRPAGLRRAEGFTRRPRLLRPATRPRHRAPRRPTPARQPARRDPARLPQNRHPVRRTHRMGAPPTRSTTCCLTSQIMGCLSLGRGVASAGADESRQGGVGRWWCSAGSTGPSSTMTWR